MRIKISTILGLILLISINGYSQLRSSPKKIKFQDEYLHKETKTQFPKAFDELNLTEATSFDKRDNNIGVTYEKDGTRINIYLYQDEFAAEGRLRNEFANVFRLIFQKDFKKEDFTIITHKGEEYICHGIRGVIKAQNGKNELLTIFECGTWLFKIRITSDLKEQKLVDIENKIVDKLDPSRLIGLKLLKLKGAITFSSTELKDTTMLAATMGYTFRKFSWLIENLAEKERYSGFQDLYIDMHREALKKFVEFGNKSKYPSRPETKEYIKNLTTIIQSPYLSEFLMEQYEMILIVPEGTILKFDEYNKWKRG